MNHPSSAIAAEVAAASKARIRALARKYTLTTVAEKLGVTPQEAYRMCVWAEQIPTNVNAHRAADLQGQYTLTECSQRWGVTLKTATTIARNLALAGFPVRPKQGRPLQGEAYLEQLKRWAADCDGTRSHSQLCELWGVTDSGVSHRLRAMRAAGLEPRMTRPHQPAGCYRQVQEVGLDLPTIAAPVIAEEPEGPVLPSAGPSAFTRAFMRRPTAPHSPDVQAILDRLYGVAA